MRSLVALLKGLEGPEAAPRSGRPEALRRATLATNSLFMAVASGLGLPFAIYALLHGMLLPVVLALVGLGTGL